MTETPFKEWIPDAPQSKTEKSLGGRWPVGGPGGGMAGQALVAQPAELKPSRAEHLELKTFRAEHEELKRALEQTLYSLGSQTGAGSGACSVGSRTGAGSGADYVGSQTGADSVGSWTEAGSGTVSSP